MTLVDRSSLTMTLEQNGEYLFTGSISGKNVWQRLSVSVPCIVIYDPTSTNFLTVTDVSSIDPSFLLYDVVVS